MKVFISQPMNGKSNEEIEADVVYFAKGWENARGCRIEHTVAKEYGLKIMEEK